MKMLRRVFMVGLIFTLLLAGCTGATPNDEGDGGESSTDTSPSTQVGAIISATGEVVPAEWTTLSFQQGGKVVEVLVERGDTVKSGDLIARVDTADLNIDLSQAEAVLAQREASLAKVIAAPREEEVNASKLSLAAANARISAAVSRRNQLYSSITEAQIQQAQYDLDQARRSHTDLVESMEDLVAWAETADLEDYEPGEDSNPLASGEDLARSIEFAELQLEVAQSYLDDLLDGPDPNSIRVQNARIAVAAARAQAAQARLDLLLAGPLQENIDIAEAEIEQAEADITIIEARIAQTEVLAPFDGTITELFVDEGEFVSVGQQAAQIGSLDTLRIETTDLNEIDVPRIKEGDTVNITFDALPDLQLEGTITRISPKVAAGTGVNYTVIIELDSIPDRVRWGMTAFVDVEVE